MIPSPARMIELFFTHGGVGKEAAHGGGRSCPLHYTDHRPRAFSGDHSYKVE